MQLTKIRHPRILTVQHPLEEGRDSLAFVTEPVFQSLSNIFGNYANMPPSAEANVKPFNFHEIEIKYGLIQLMEGLQFLHSDMKMIHRNICPESVVLNVEGGWKLFGFDYCSILSGEGGQSTVNRMCRNKGICCCNRSWIMQHPNGSSMAVQCAPAIYIHLVSVAAYLSRHPNPSANDCNITIRFPFSGILIYTMHSSNKRPLKLFGTDVDGYKRFAADVKLGKYPNLNCIPNGIVDNVRLMLHYSPDLRPNLFELPKVTPT